MLSLHVKTLNRKNNIQGGGSKFGISFLSATDKNPLS